MPGEQVALEEWLYRRGYSTPEKKYVNPDGTATSRVFKLRAKDNGQLSVDVKSLTTPEIAVKDPSKFMLFEIANGSVAEIGLTTFHDPLPDGSNDAHAVILGMDENDDVTPGVLARSSQRIIL